MKSRWGSFLGLVATLTIVGSAAAFWIIQAGNRKKPAPPAAVAPASQTRSVKEGELNILTLTAEAQKRLDVQTVKIARKDIRRSLGLGGDVVLPPGQSIAVTAPFAATLKAASMVTPGQAVARDQELLALVPLLTNEARTSLATALVDAEGQVKNADVQLKAATIALERARQLLSEQAGSKRAVDEAQAAFDLAQKTLDAARARRELLARTLEGADAGSVTVLKVSAPISGVVRSVQAAPGQVVAAGATLMEVANLATLWVRVPVYVGDVDQVQADGEATLNVPGGDASQTTPVKPAPAPPTATSATATRDLYYQIENAKQVYAPGQRVIVNLPLKTEAAALVVPWSAVVHDVNGGAWVYENTAPLQFVRRRVQVARVAEGEAVLASGPAAGTAVVTQGVAELWGREMGFGK